MAECPSCAELQDFLSDSLPPERDDLVQSHLEQCAACQQFLDSLTSGAVGQNAANDASPGSRAPKNSHAPPVHGLSRQIGQYTLIRELGEGGMGVVYLAEQFNLKRPVAVKIIRHGVNATAEEIARFCAEAEAVARLHHPNIVHVHEVGSQEGVHYLVFEYISGGSLDQYLAGTPQEPHVAASLTETLARAVHHAHQRGILHRDLKPANVLLQVADEKPERPIDGFQPFDLRAATAKVTDFGLAKRLDEGDGRTQTGMLLGTPSYMAPEQVSAKAELTAAVDVYGLGAILYEMLTGRPPFKGASPLSTMEQVTSQEPLAPRQFQRHLPPDIETICLNCLRKEPHLRYPGALELADDLRRFLSGKPVHARPVGPMERLWKWALRRPGVAGLTAAVVLVTAAALVLLTWQWQWAEGEAERARRAEGTAEERRREAEEVEARLALQQGQILCEQGNLDAGLLWLARSLERAVSAGTTDLERPIRVNLAHWGAQLRPPGIRLKNPAPVLGLAFDPADRMLLAAGKDGLVHCWDIAAGREVGRPLEHPRFGQQTWVRFVEFSPDGGSIATAGEQFAMTWNAVTHEPDGAPLLHTPGMLWGMAFFADGQRLATCSDDGSARVWDLTTRRVVSGPFWHPKGAAGDWNPTHNGYYTLAVSPDGQTLVTAGSDGRVIGWDLGSGETVGTPLEHDSTVLSVVFTPNGKLLTATRAGTVHAWDLRTGRGTNLPPQGTEVNAIQLAPDGRRFATVSGFGVVRVWDTDSLQPIGTVYRQSVGATAIAFSRDGRRLAMGMEDGGIQIVELPPSPEVAPPCNVGDEIRSLEYTVGGDRLMTGTKHGVRWVEAATGRLLDGCLLDPVDWDLACAALSPDGHSLAVGRWAKKQGSFCGRLQWWNPSTGQRRDESSDLPDAVRVVVYSPDGRKLFACGNRLDLDGGAALWDVATGERLRPLLRSLGHVIVRQAAFAPDGRVLLLACSDGRARLWDTDADTEVGPTRPLSHVGAVMACAFGPGGRRVLTGGQDGTARLWDVETHAPLAEPLHHDAEVSAVAFGKDGQTVLTASLDGTVRFWDAGSGRQLDPVIRHAGGVSAVAFDRADRRVATGGKDGAVHQWLLPPPPLEGSPEGIRLWAELATQMQLDAKGTVGELRPEDLVERRRRWQDLGAAVRIPAD